MNLLSPKLRMKTEALYSSPKHPRGTPKSGLTACTPTSSSSRRLLKARPGNIMITEDNFNTTMFTLTSSLTPVTKQKYQGPQTPIAKSLIDHSLNASPQNILTRSSVKAFASPKSRRSTTSTKPIDLDSSTIKIYHALKLQKRERLSSPDKTGRFSAIIRETETTRSIHPDVVRLTVGEADECTERFSVGPATTKSSIRSKKDFSQQLKNYLSQQDRVKNKVKAIKSLLTTNVSSSNLLKNIQQENGLKEEEDRTDRRVKVINLRRSVKPTVGKPVQSRNSILRESSTDNSTQIGSSLPSMSSLVSPSQGRASILRKSSIENRDTSAGIGSLSTLKNVSSPADSRPSITFDVPIDNKENDIGSILSPKLHKSIRSQNVLDNNEEFKLRGELKGSIRPFIFDNLDMSKFKYSSVFFYDESRRRRRTRGAGRGDQLIGSREKPLKLKEKVKSERMTSLERSQSDLLIKEKSFLGLVNEVKVWNNLKRCNTDCAEFQQI